jgi:hypothetical protein
MYKVHDNFSAKLIGAEGARLLRETPQAQVAPRRLPRPPLERKSTAKFNRQLIEGGAPKSYTFGTPSKTK